MDTRNSTTGALFRLLLKSLADDGVPPVRKLPLNVYLLRWLRFLYIR